MRNVDSRLSAWSRAELETALRQCDARFEGVLTQPLVGVALIQRNGIALRVNHALCDMLRCRAEDIVAHDVLRRCHPDDARHLRDHLRNVTRDGEGETAALECRWIGSNEKVVWSHLTLTRIHDGGSQPGCVLMLMVDVSASHQAQAQLRQFNATLEQRVRERTAEAEHRAAQLRTLASELSAAEFRERRQLAQYLHDHLQQTLVAAKMRLSGITRLLRSKPGHDQIIEVDRLLAQALTESRMLTVELSPPVLDDAGLGPALAWLARQMEQKHKLTVEIDYEGDECAAPQEYRLLLFQVVRELLFNVVKHAEVNAARVAVRCIAGEATEIVVEDEGRGFDPQLLRDAVDPSGFGLMSARERLAATGAELEIQSAPGRGTRVRIYAPSSAVNPSADTSFDAEPGVTASEPNGDDHRDEEHGDATRVLLVDDHQIMRDGLVSLLREVPGVVVVGEACDGREAVYMARHLKPDVIIMDISMPRMNGIEATRVITREHPNIRVIGLSMHEKDDMAAAMRDAGAVAFHTKGGPSDDLVAAVRAS